MTSKNTYSYYKKLYKAYKRYRDKIGDYDYGMMLSQSEFADMQNAGLNANEVAYNQFHFYSKDIAKQIQKSLKAEGYKLSIKNIQSRNYSPEIYAKIEDYYHTFRAEGYSSMQVAALISYTFYGS